MEEMEKREVTAEAAPEGQVSAQEDGRKAALRAHFQDMVRQGAEVRKVYPRFNLEQELRDPRFAAMTAPGTGVDVRTAFEALHRQEIAPAMMAYAAKKAEEKLAGAVRSGSLRPLENGAQGAGAVLQDDPRNLTRQERAEIRKRVRRGEKVVW